MPCTSKKGMKMSTVDFQSPKGTNLFLQIKGKQGTFHDMAVEKAKILVKPFTQHFNLRRPQVFIRPNLHVTHSINLAARDIAQ